MTPHPPQFKRRHLASAVFPARVTPWTFVLDLLRRGSVGRLDRSLG